MSVWWALWGYQTGTHSLLIEVTRYQVKFKYSISYCDLIRMRVTWLVVPTLTARWHALLHMIGPEENRGHGAQTVMGCELLNQFPRSVISTFSELSKHWSSIECRVRICQVSSQLSCGHTLQIWTWFEGHQNQNVCPAAKLTNAALATPPLLSTWWY